jgi:hypothetical protein
MWEDGVRYRRPTKLPAPEYVDALMNWAQGPLDDEAIFPNKIGSPYAPVFLSRNLALNTLSGVPFPRTFRDTVRTIFRRLFRVYAHIYSSHFDHICALGIEGPLTAGGVNLRLSQRISIQVTGIFSYLSLTIYYLRFSLASAVRSCRQERARSVG